MPRHAKIKIVCEDCGGDRVTRDAWAEWDVEAQQWTLASVYDAGFCHHCENWANLEEIALAEPEAAQ